MIVVFNNSALQLNDDIHLSLSSATSPIPGFYDEAAFVDIDLSSSSKNATTSNVVTCGGNKYELAYREVKSVPTRSASWYDGFLGCLKPVMNLMGKGKPSGIKDEKGIAILAPKVGIKNVLTWLEISLKVWLQSCQNQLFCPIKTVI